MRWLSKEFIFLSILFPGAAAGQEVALFSDDFDRADSALVGNGWQEFEQAGAAVEISSNRLHFADTSDRVLRPMVVHGFSEVVSGILQWEFQFDWTRTGGENFYSVHMQLGDGSQMSDQSMDAGVAVNLLWSRIGGVDELLGYRQGGAVTALTGTSGLVNVQVRVDLDQYTYEVEVDGTVVQSQIPFDAPAPIDTVRFFTDGVNEVNFAGQAFDALSITAQQSGPPGNSTPVANFDSYGVDQDTLLSVAAPGILGNDTDVDGDGLSASLVSPVANGSLTLLGDGSFSYQPDAGFSGIDSFSYLANDGTADSATAATVSITVSPVNQAPVANFDSYSVDQDTLLSVAAPGILGNDTDVDGDGLSASLVSPVANGSLTLLGDGSFSYQPDAGFSGIDSFSYLANDGTADSATAATVSITVSPVNQAPVANFDSYSVDQDTLLSVAAPGTLGNDTDVDGDGLSASLVSPVANGSLTLLGDGSFSYQPDAGFSGIDSFSYLANDGTADSATAATVSITVSPVNQAPVANFDSYSVDQDTLLSVAAPGTLGNDTDVDGDGLSASLVSPVANGSLTLLGDGSFSYQPDAGFSGIDSFSYLANDGTADSATAATVSIIVSQEVALFSDDFDRADSALVGNGWQEFEQAGAAVEISSNRLHFADTSDRVLRPMVVHGFSEVVSGILQWEFQFDWTRTGGKNFYSVHMQLGDGSQMSDQSMDAGVAVNLLWSRIGGVDELLGYRQGGAVTALTGTSGLVNVQVRVDLDQYTYEVEVDGTVVQSQIPFDAPAPIDTVRFFTDGVNEVNFAGQAFDALSITAQRLVVEPDRWQPQLGASWWWQIENTSEVDVDLDVDVFDVDLFEGEESGKIAELIGAGKRIVCYFSAGTYEPFRPDAMSFTEESVISGSNLPQFGEELWLNIGSADALENVIKPIMRARLDLAEAAGCDAVEPDNVDGYENDDTLGMISEQEQLSYNRWIAVEAHERGLSVGLKNDLNQVGALSESFDFAINEQCYGFGNNCMVYETTFLAAGKPVFSQEYAASGDGGSVGEQDYINAACPYFQSQQIASLWKSGLNLDGQGVIICTPCCESYENN